MRRSISGSCGPRFAKYFLPFVSGGCCPFLPGFKGDLLPDPGLDRDGTRRVCPPGRPVAAPANPQ